MKLRRLTGQRLPCLRKDSTPQLWQETAALRDFAPAYDRCGSNSVIAVMSAARPLFHQEQTFVGKPTTSVSCHNPTSVTGVDGAENGDTGPHHSVQCG